VQKCAKVCAEKPSLIRHGVPIRRLTKIDGVSNSVYRYTPPTGWLNQATEEYHGHSARFAMDRQKLTVCQIGISVAAFLI